MLKIEAATAGGAAPHRGTTRLRAVVAASFVTLLVVVSVSVACSLVAGFDGDFTIILKIYELF